MTELRFHRELYDGTAVDAAVKCYARFAAFELVEEPTHWLVRVTSKNAARETQVAHEVGNYALGTTIRERGGSQ